MSYLDVTNYKYWDFNDAFDYYMKENENSEEKAISAFSRDLASKGNKTASNWRENWKNLLQRYQNRHNVTDNNTPNNPTSSSLLRDINISQSRNVRTTIKPVIGSSVINNRESKESHPNQTKELLSTPKTTGFMESFTNKYKLMEDEKKWKLETGTIVEDKLYEFGKNCKFEHLCHSFILDPYDKTYSQRHIFKEEELEEIKRYNAVSYPELPDDLVEHLAYFETGTTPNDLRRLLHLSSEYNLNYNKERDQVKDWINRTLSQLVLLYEKPTSSFGTDHSEQWFQSRVWLFLEYAFEDIENVLACRGEQVSLATSDRSNFSRVVPSFEKVESKKFGSRVDMIIRLYDLELLMEEDKPNIDNTKILEDRSFKIGKEMKDALWAQFSYINYDPTKLKSLITFGISTFKFNIYFDLSDYKNGYITRITRSEVFTIPTTLSRVEDILELLSMVIIFKTMVQKNIDILTCPNSTSNLRRRLKRPYDNQDDSFIKVTKQIYCAQSPDDGTTTRFKSIITAPKK